MRALSFQEKLNTKTVIIILILVLFGVCIQCYLASIDNEYTRYNNYVIFKQAFIHLVSGSNLYEHYAAEHYDLYKYSPTFAFFMGIFYYLPDVTGLLLFNFLNLAVFVIAFKKLNWPDNILARVFIFLLLEIAISLTSTQTNLLMAGLIILAFYSMERSKIFIATLCIALTVYIKIFGLVAFCLWLFYPGKLKFLLYAAFWMILLAILPLSIVSYHSLEWQYQNWLMLLRVDHNASYGASFLGFIHSWFGVELPKMGTIVSAVILFLIPLCNLKRYKEVFFRMQILASILIWIVIFNHKAENPTYIIAMAGVGIWYFSQETTKVNKVLLYLCLLFTSCSSTDLITPGFIANKYVEPFAIKAIFCIAIWFKLIYDLAVGKSKPAAFLKNQG